MYVNVVFLFQYLIVPGSPLRWCEMNDKGIVT
jgi:hypothetical protein